MEGEGGDGVGPRFVYGGNLEDSRLEDSHPPFVCLR